jgi:hypothetical protein
MYEFYFRMHLINFLVKKTKSSQILFHSFGFIMLNSYSSELDILNIFYFYFLFFG